MGRRSVVVSLRIAARRPASWLSLALVAALACGLGGAAGAAWPAAAIVGGAMGACAALGSLPREAAAGWAVSRCVWPAAGAVCGWVASGSRPAAAAVLLASCVATAVAVTTATSAGAAPAIATGTALALAVAAGLAASATALTTPSAWPAVAVAAWVGAAAAMATLRRIEPLAHAIEGGTRAGSVPRGVMLSALVTMVPYLLLAPHLAWCYAVVAAAWLLASAVPRAALGPGARGAAGRRILVATTGRGSRPGLAAARLVAAYAAVLAWPPLVAAMLAGATGAAARPLAIAAAIAGGAAVIAATVAATVAVVHPVDDACDTVHAVVLCGVAAVAAVWWTGPRWATAPANPQPGLMLSNPGDPATLPGPREEPRLRLSPRGVALCPACPPSAPPLRAASSRRHCSS